jgi:hypothetical protein
MINCVYITGWIKPPRQHIHIKIKDFGFLPPQSLEDTPRCNVFISQQKERSPSVLYISRQIRWPRGMAHLSDLRGDFGVCGDQDLGEMTSSWIRICEVGAKSAVKLPKARS